MTTKTIAGVPVGGLKTVGQIIGTNDLLFHTGQNGLAVAVELLSTHTPGAPVVDDRGEFIGFISEFDVLRALEVNKDLSKVTYTVTRHDLLRSWIGLGMGMGLEA